MKLRIREEEEDHSIIRGGGRRKVEWGGRHTLWQRQQG